MKLALQLRLIPLEKTIDQVKWAKDHGVEGIELGTAQPDALRKTTAEMKGVLPVVSVCGNCSIDAPWSFDFLDPDPAKRKKSMDGSKATLEFCGEVGATGQIVPPIFGPCRMPDLSPYKTGMELQEEVMIRIARELGDHAAKHKTLFMLEPLNRYEQHYLRKQSDGVRIIKKAKSKGVGLLSDFFHMHIEETDTPDAFLKYGKFTNHIHLADNTRMEPGTGDIDFVAGFKALLKVNFRGYMAYECGISGSSPAEQQKNLAKSLDYVRACVAQARA